MGTSNTLNIGNLIYATGLSNFANPSTAVSTGNVGIGTTSPYALLSISNSKTTTAGTPLFSIASTTNGTATTTVFSVASTGDVTINGSSGGTCVIGNGAGATLCTSDERLKTNITAIPNALHDIEQIKGVTFNWADPTKNQNQFIGVIAQDVQKVFPQAVATLGDGYLAVDYGALVAPLIEAVKELAGKVSSLTATVAGFAETFTTNHLCVNKTDGSSVCITGDQLNTLLNNSGQQASAPPAAGGDAMDSSSSSSDSDTASSTDLIIIDDAATSTDSTPSTDLGQASSPQADSSNQ